MVDPKVDTKTITRLLTDDQAADYQPWFANARRARELLGELETLSLGIVEADPRSARRPGGRKPATHPSHEPGDNTTVTAEFTRSGHQPRHAHPGHTLT